MTASIHRGRRTLLLLALVFLGPMAVAMVLYYTGFQWRPSSTTEHGVLYQPVRPLPDLSMTLLGGGDAQFRGKWTLLYVGPGNCPSDCRAALVTIRQVRRALGRDMDRVQRLFLRTGAGIAAPVSAGQHPGLGLAQTTPGPAWQFLIDESGAGVIFLVDPLGNLVMRYPAGSPMKGIYTDLKRLLKISTIG